MIMMMNAGPNGDGEGKTFGIGTYLSFSVPKIEAKYSAIVHMNLLRDLRLDSELDW